MSDDLVAAVKRAYPEWRGTMCEECGLPIPICNDRALVREHDVRAERTAQALTEARAEIERLTGERDEARGIVRDTYWMAVRYADGRMSYAPGMCNRAIQKAYDAGWLTYHDHKQHDHDPQYAREGDRPEYRSIEDRAIAAESELSTLRARVREVVGLGLDVISEERGWGTYPRMEGSEIYTDADVFSRAARQLMEDLK